MTSAKSGIMCLVLIVLAILSSSQAITIQLNKNNKKVCFYIRGEDVDTDFALHYGYSGDGYEQVKTTNIKEEKYLFSVGPGEQGTVAGHIGQAIVKDQVYTACFESLDNNSKQLSLGYSQVKRQKHFTKGDIIENQIKLDTRLSFFQSNIFTHTQEPQKQPDMEQSNQDRSYAFSRRHSGQSLGRTTGIHQVKDH